eukprot:2015880-Rhodomonas_salina.5
MIGDVTRMPVADTTVKGPRDPVKGCPACVSQQAGRTIAGIWYHRGLCTACCVRTVAGWYAKSVPDIASHARRPIAPFARSVLGIVSHARRLIAYLI